MADFKYKFACRPLAQGRYLCAGTSEVGTSFCAWHYITRYQIRDCWLTREGKTNFLLQLPCPLCLERSRGLGRTGRYSGTNSGNEREGLLYKQVTDTAKLVKER